MTSWYHFGVEFHNEFKNIFTHFYNKNALFLTKNEAIALKTHANCPKIR